MFASSLFFLFPLPRMKGPGPSRETILGPQDEAHGKGWALYLFVVLAQGNQGGGAFISGGQVAFLKCSIYENEVRQAAAGRPSHCPNGVALTCVCAALRSM